MSPDFRSGGKTRIVMTEHDKNDLKVPRFDSLNNSLSRDTHNTKAGKTSLCCVLLGQRKLPRLLRPSSRWWKRMTRTIGSRCRCGCFSILFSTSRSPIVPASMHMTLKSSSCTWSKMMAGVQTSSMSGSLRSLLYAFTLSASATLRADLLSPHRQAQVLCRGSHVLILPGYHRQVAALRD